jgi:hypothetical protein
MMATLVARAAEKIMADAEMAGSGQFGARAGIRRGPATWAYFYVVLGFALSIEVAIIQMISFLSSWLNLILFLIVGCVTGGLVLFSGSCQDRLIRLKGRIENTPR